MLFIKSVNLILFISSFYNLIIFFFNKRHLGKLLNIDWHLGKLLSTDCLRVKFVTENETECKIHLSRVYQVQTQDTKLIETSSTEKLTLL